MHVSKSAVVVSRKLRAAHSNSHPALCLSSKCCDSIQCLFNSVSFNPGPVDSDFFLFMHYFNRKLHIAKET